MIFKQTFPFPGLITLHLLAKLSEVSIEEKLAILKDFESIVSICKFKEDGVLIYCCMTFV